MTRVLLVDDHKAFRQPLARLLALEPDIEIVAEAGSVAEAVAVDVAVDVAVVDLHLPDGHGTEIIPRFRARPIEPLVLILSGSSDDEQLARAFESGAAGVLDKSVGVDEIVDAIRRLAAGQPVMTTRQTIEMLRLAAHAREHDARGREALERITDREREVLQALAEGHSDKEIAELLGISAQTARRHVASILSKMGVDSRLRAVLFAIRHGAVTVR